MDFSAGFIINLLGVFPESAFSLLRDDLNEGTSDMGVMGSTFLTGACLLPATGPYRCDLSGELYIPNTSAKASFVARVTVGSGAENPTPFLPVIFLVLFPSSLKPTRTDRSVSEAGGGLHFLPSKPIERARASATLYSIPSSVKRRERLNRSFSGRLPCVGGARMWAYLLCPGPVNDDGSDFEEEEACPGVDFCRDDAGLGEYLMKGSRRSA